MITLKDFVKDTLAQITEGVAEFNSAQGDGVTASPKLAPAGLKTSDILQGGLIITSRIRGDSGGTEEWKYATPVDFDVAVTATETEGTKAGASVRIVQVFSAGGEASSAVTNTSVSRVKFRLPLQLR